ncbi:MAG TPA: winged helix-turn-helix domain-containing protein [Candidatus Eremiobacteraceae bacterium]|nr:winged helix-turn-helix domain-containing protein [Candidatus Eremiobacteraceae bacterium]
MVLRCDGAVVPLAPKVAITLFALIERAGQVVSKDELLQAVWGGAVVEESNLSQNVYTLRRHFEVMSGESLIETLPRRGYRFTCDVRKRQPYDRDGQVRSTRASSILVAAAVVAAIGIVLCVSGARTIVPASVGDSPSLLADQAYATGWYYYRQGTVDGFHTALRYFEHAATLRPESPLGMAGEAITYAQLSDNEGDSPSAVADASRADWLAYHTLVNYPASSEALAAKGFVEFDVDGAFSAATRDLQRAEALDSQNAPAFLWFGSVMLWQGRLAPARAQLQRAARLDSTLPTIDYLLAWDYYFSRDFGDATAFATLAVSDSWTGNDARLLLAAADEESGKFVPAVAAVSDLIPGPTDDIAASATRAHIDATVGDMAGAARELRTVERLTARYKQRPLLTAIAYLANGKLDETFAWLSRLSQYDRTVLAMDPRLDRVRHDPRFTHWLHG